MKYVEAFNSLGYSIPNPRQDWSAEKDGRVCITLWRKEIDWTPPPPSFDLWSLHTPGQTDWENLRGHATRTRHIKRAASKLPLKVDMIIVGGVPSEGYKTADPWLPDDYNGYGWFITKFDEVTGYFSAVVAKLSEARTLQEPEDD